MGAGMRTFFSMLSVRLCKFQVRNIQILLFLTDSNDINELNRRDFVANKHVQYNYGINMVRWCMVRMMHGDMVHGHVISAFTDTWAKDKYFMVRTWSSLEMLAVALVFCLISLVVLSIFAQNDFDSIYSG